MSGFEIIPLLVGSAGTAATATTAATAATAGLFGVGGSLTLGGVLSGVGTLFSLGSGIMGLSAAKGEEAQIKTQQQVEKTRAAQEEADRQARLTTILNDSLAMQAGRGGRLGSASDLAITGFSEEEAKRESRIASLDSKYRQDQLRMQRAQARTSGYTSLISGATSAASRFGTRLEGQFERTRTI